MDLESLCYVTIIAFTVVLSPLGSRNCTAIESIRIFHFYYHSSRDFSDRIIRAEKEEQKEGGKGHYPHFRSNISEIDSEGGMFYYCCILNVFIHCRAF